MALIEFKDLPDKSTPLNATNLNHNFNELNIAIDELESELNTINQLLTNMKTRSLDGWYNFAVAEGSGFRKDFPIFNPTGEMPTINITSCRIYTNSAWNDVDISNISAYYVTITSVTLYFKSPITIANDKNILVALSGTIKCA